MKIRWYNSCDCLLETYELQTGESVKDAMRDLLDEWYIDAGDKIIIEED